jgi:hypothetical protein
MARFAVLLLALSFGCPAHAQTSQPPAEAKANPSAKKPASPKAASAHPAASGPCIGVIPAVGDRFGVKKIGLTVFGNEFKEITVEKWGLDDLVVQRVQAAVGTGIVARRIAYPKGAFDTYRQAAGLFRNNENSADLIRQVAGPVPCERYVVVTNSSTPIVGNQNISGVGIVLTGGSFLTKPLVHAVVHVAVHDGRTFAVLKEGIATLNGNTPLMGGHQTLKLDDTAWPEPPEAANTPAMRDATRKLLAGILDGSLPGLLSR